MKKQFLILICLLGLSSLSFAQRHLKGGKGIEVDAGITALGWYIEPDFTYFLSPKSMLKLGLQYEAGKVQELGFSAYSINASYNYALFNIKNTVFVDAKAGLNGNLSRLNDLELNGTKENYFNGGAFIGAETETYFSDKMAWTLNFRQLFYFKNEFGSKVYYVGTGIKYLF